MLWSRLFVVNEPGWAIYEDLKRVYKESTRPEASIRYITEETIQFCLEYIEKAKPIGPPESRHDERVEGKGSGELNVITLGLEELQQVHLYILNNNTEVVPYIVHHEALVKEVTQKWSRIGCWRSITRFS